MASTVRRRFTILGCGSSPGVPRIDGNWGACDPHDPRNRRTRASFLIEQFSEDGGRTAIVVDTGADFRAQMIAAEVPSLDAVLYTHPHADHIHGIDDVRIYALAARKRMPIYAAPDTMARIREGFAYCIETPPGSAYPPIVVPVLIEDDRVPLTIQGAGGPVSIQPLRQEHGAITSLGFRVGDVAYCCDISGFPETTLPYLEALDVLIIDALQYERHPSHLSLDEALGWVGRLRPRQTYLTHMHIPLDYATVDRETPDHVTPAHDLLRFERLVELDTTSNE